MMRPGSLFMASARAVSQSGWNSARVGASLGTRRVPSSAGRPNMPRSSRSASITLMTPVADPPSACSRSKRNSSYWPRAWATSATAILPAWSLTTAIFHAS